MAGFQFGTTHLYPSGHPPRYESPARKNFRSLTLSMGLPLLLAWLAASAWAGVGGRISGTVTDSTGAVFPKAVVTVVDDDTRIRQAVTTG